MFLTCRACLLMDSLNNTSVSPNVPLVKLVVSSLLAIGLGILACMAGITS